jgi:hypothetical protein
MVLDGANTSTNHTLILLPTGTNGPIKTSHHYPRKQEQLD